MSTEYRSTGTLYRRCQLSTDTPPILYRYLTDGSPIYCRHTTDAIATDCRPMIGQSVGRISADTRPTLGPPLDRHMTDISTDMSTDSRPRYRSLRRSTPPIRHKIRGEYDGCSRSTQQLASGPWRGHTQLRAPACVARLAFANSLSNALAVTTT